MGFFSRNRIFVSFTFMVLFSLSSMAVRSGMELSVKSVVTVTISPFQHLFHATYSTVEQLWAGLTELNTLRQELKQTRQRLEQYEGVAQNLEEIKRENRRLRELLGYKKRSLYPVIAAEVISKNPDNYYRVLILNKGSWHGVKKNMPVVAYQGGEQALVGRVAEVQVNLSKIMPVIDPRSRFGGLLQKNRYVGLLSGKYPRRSLLKMDYISSSAQHIEKGEEVITSGQGGLFPKGLLVGRVHKVDERASAGFIHCLVKPHIDFAKLDQVLIIQKKLDEKLQQMDEPVKEAKKVR